MKNKKKELNIEIDKVIWEDWDPIGVNETEEARDEYYSYLPMIFKMLLEGKNKKG